MFGRLRFAFAALALSLAGCATVPSAVPGAQGPDLWTASCEDWDEWEKQGPPFRVHGSTYYVGTCGISAILITGDKGHVLIDSGTEAGAEIVMRNMELLGFDIRDVEYLLHSHEHFDHTGGFARLQAESGAKVIASTGAAQVLAAGVADESDPQAAMLPDMAPVEVHRTISNGGTVELGDIRLTAIETPGHTPGALSWQWESCDNNGCLSLVYADSLSPISAEGYRFTDHPAYVARFRKGLARLAATDCDLLLTPHPSASRMRTRLLREAPLVDAASCRDYAAGIEARLAMRLSDEAGGD